MWGNNLICSLFSISVCKKQPQNISVYQKSVSVLLATTGFFKCLNFQILDCVLICGNSCVAAYVKETLDPYALEKLSKVKLKFLYKNIICLR